MTTPSADDKPVSPLRGAYGQPVWHQHMGRCVHFNGPAVNETCQAGVNYKALAGGKGPGWTSILPCFKPDLMGWKRVDDGRPVAECAKATFLSEEQAKEKEREDWAVAASYFDKLNNEICPHCDTPIGQYDQVGRCVYAKPCGHRLYQGRVPKKVVTP